MLILLFEVNGNCFIYLNFLGIIYFGKCDFKLFLIFLVIFVLFVILVVGIIVLIKWIILLFLYIGIIIVFFMNLDWCNCVLIFFNFIL